MKIFCLSFLTAATVSIAGYFLIYKNATLVVANTNPFSVSMVYSYKPNPKDVVTSDWISLQPGEKVEFEHRYRGKSVSFAVHAKSTNPAVVGWIYHLQESDPRILYFDQDQDGVSSFRIAFGALLAFAPIETNEVGRATHIILDPQFQFLTIQNTSEDELNNMLQRSRILARSIDHQMSFEKKYKNPAMQFPYHFALDLDDYNGFAMPGVAIVSVNASTSIFGTPVRVKAGEVIVGINGFPIFSVSDLYWYLEKHATNVDCGIKKPIALTILNAHGTQTVSSSYFFNESFYHRSEKEARQAVLMGVVDGIGVGFGATVSVCTRRTFQWLANILDPDNKKALGDYDTEHWRYTQKEARFRQMYGSDFHGGSFLGMFISPGQLFAKSAAKSVAKRGMAKSASRFTASASIEFAEGMVYSLNELAPDLTAQEKLSKLRPMLLETTGVAIVTGSLIRKRK